MIGHWIGWDWEEEYHVTMSKRHFIKDFPRNKYAVCGTRVADHASNGQGDDGCRRCEKWCKKNYPEALQY